MQTVGVAHGYHPPVAPRRLKMAKLQSMPKAWQKVAGASDLSPTSGRSAEKFRPRRGRREEIATGAVSGWGSGTPFGVQIR
jgi:hypothetical protein